MGAVLGAWAHARNSERKAHRRTSTMYRIPHPAGSVVVSVVLLVIAHKAHWTPLRPTLGSITAAHGPDEGRPGEASPHQFVIARVTGRPSSESKAQPLTR